MKQKISFDFNGRKRAGKNLKKGLTIGALTGTALGAAVGILFAPKSGKETRNDIKEGAVKVAEGVSGTVSNVGEGAKKLYSDIRNMAKKPDVEETVAEEAVAVREEEVE